VQFSCDCGAKADEHLPLCPRCGRVGSYMCVVTAPSPMPHAYPAEVLSAGQLRARAQMARALPPPWGELSPSWQVPFLLLLWGCPGTGKTTQALRLADSWPGRALFVAVEGGLGVVLSQMAARLELTRPHFVYPSTWDELVSAAADYDLIIVDSLQTIAATAESLRSELVDRAAKSLVLTSQVNAQGEVRGGMAASHLADVSAECVRFGEIVVHKNRFAPMPSMKEAS